ncbi:ATP-dependent helicase [Porticoccaceae bacterium]|nr:ATP-dependent helicase [Porticoccaceae bacterium]MDB2343164.1 ATP-dependent helicase [Porticoccaceae bacterium]
MPSTNEQKEIIRHDTGHARVTAGAGTGKSTVLVARIKRLIEKGVSPGKIRVLMFNTSASDEFNSKLKAALNTSDYKSLPRTTTFHGAGTQLINILLKDQPLISKARLDASSYSHKQFIRQIVDPFIQVDKKKPAGPSLYEDFATYVDLVKTSLSISHIDAFRNTRFDQKKYGWFVQAYEKYEERRHELKIRFFSDLIYDPMMVISSSPEAKKRVQQFCSYHHVIVDEYQDINEIQQDLVQLFSQKEDCSVMVVGDADQTIYGFRGARPEYIVKEFEELFPNVINYTLSQTFRHGHALTSIAQQVIGNNDSRVEMLSTSSPLSPETRVLLEVKSFDKPNITANIRRWCDMDPDHSINDIAILLRTFSASVGIEIELLQEKIPYRMSGGRTLFSQAEIGSMIAAMHIAKDSLQTSTEKDRYKHASAFLRYPKKGIDKDEISEIVKLIARNPSTASSTIRTRSTNPNLRSFQRRALSEKADLWEWLTMLSQEKASTVMEIFMEKSGIHQYILTTEMKAERQEELSEIFRSFEDYVKVSLEERKNMDLNAVIDHFDELEDASMEVDDNASESILITSVHRSKGLEWPMIILPELWEGSFPYISREKAKVTNIEDERRLFYVAVTRAQKELVLISPFDRHLDEYLSHGKGDVPDWMGKSRATASRFLYETSLYLGQQMPGYVSDKEAPENIKEIMPTTMKKYLEKTLLSDNV